MDDKITPIDETSEYKFSEAEGETPTDNSFAEEHGSETVVPEKSKFPFKLNFKSINWQRFKGPGIIALLILAVYMLFNFYSASKTRKLEQEKIMAQEGAALVKQKNTMAVDQAALLNSARTQANSEMRLGAEQLAQIQNMVQTKIDNVVQQLQQVTNNQDRSSNLSEAVTKNQQDIYALGQRVEQLTFVMQQLVTEFQKLKAPVTPKAKVKAKKASSKAPLVAYHIRAIVPGRVWLESEDGSSVTLRVGDKLDGYGEVRVISPRQGMVVMSNGAVIQYGLNDF